MKMNYATKLKKMVADGDTAPAVIEACELVEAVLAEIEDVHGRAMLDEIGWELCRVQGEEDDVSLVRCVGSYVVNTRCSTWKAQDGGS